MTFLAALGMRIVRHSLSYSHSDQALLRDPGLDHCWDGLVVPGTLAAYYFEGTGGFVLTRRVPYIIDPRTPLLQTLDVGRSEPKASHLKLAAIHDPDVVAAWPDNEITRTHWEDGRWPDVVRRVLTFQDSYSRTATAKVEKYNALLAEAGRRVVETDPDDPLRLVPPYWAVASTDDPWWALSRQAIEIGLNAHPGRILPIIATCTGVGTQAFSNLIDDLPDGCEDVFCWASNWNEATADEQDIADWIRAIDAANVRGIKVSNLYGGYLSVLLIGRGLAGLNHGVGYSEKRDSERLSSTGAPVARYYIRALREFMTVPSAQPVLDFLPAEWACDCAVCKQVTGDDGRPQIGRLSTDGLKRHFLIARHREIECVEADLQAELDDLVAVGEWVVANERLFLTAEHGRRLLRWAAAVRF